MATIGIFTATENGYEGFIETLAFRAKVTIEHTKKNGDHQPDYRVYLVTERYKSDIGAAWKKTSQAFGTEYLSASIDDPIFPARISCRLVKTGAEHAHTLYWDRPRPEQE